MRRLAGVHWLRENAQERAPWRVLVVDTETRPVRPDRPDHQSLALWCARLDRRRGVDPGKPRQERYRGHTAAELVDLVESLVRADHALWVMFHNLSFDLAVTALPVGLTDRGWRMTEGALTTESPWCRFARGSRRLTIADTWSWLPASRRAPGRAAAPAQGPAAGMGRPRGRLVAPLRGRRRGSRPTPSPRSWTGGTASTWATGRSPGPRPAGRATATGGRRRGS